MNESHLPSRLLTATLLFCRALRERGLAVTPAEAITAITALDLIDGDDRQELFLSLRAILTSRVEDFPIFSELFEAFWNRLSDSTRPQKRVEREASATLKSQARLTARNAPQRGLAFFLEHWGSQASPDAESIKLPVASRAERHAEKDFRCFEADELEEVSRLARRIVRHLAQRPSRRWQPVARGRNVHLRRTMRQSLRTGGEIIELRFKQRKPKKTRLVVLCDVSGSMDIYSRLLLQFAHGLQNSFARVESFIFSTALERITGHLKGYSYAETLDHLTDNVRGWSGGTLIGASLAAFHRDWPHLVDRRTIVMILSDGWDTGEPEELASVLADLRRRAGRVIWLNPLLGSADYQPLVRGMQAALPHLDVFAPLHNLASLRALERHLIL